MEYCCAAKINKYSRLRKDSSTNKAKGGIGGAGAVLNCSHVVRAENNVIIVDPPNWPQNLTSHILKFQHVTNNAKSKSSGFGHAYDDTHDVVDFSKKAIATSIPTAVKGVLRLY